jgi:hypothetical protein
MKIRFGKAMADVASIQALPGYYSDHDLAKPTRSTVPLLCYCMPDLRRIGSLVDQLRGRCKDFDLFFEFPTPSINTKAKSSFTDLGIALVPRGGIAIEAKWTEPAYATIQKWIAAGEYPDSRKKVVDHWLCIMGPYLKKPLSVGDLPLDTIIYQMLHRTASACNLANSGGPVRVVYQVFETEGAEHPDYGAAIRTFMDAVVPGPSLWFFVHKVVMKPTPQFAKLQKRCAGQSDADSAAAIRKAIVEEELFTFVSESLTEIGSGWKTSCEADRRG